MIQEAPTAVVIVDLHLLRVINMKLYTVQISQWRKVPPDIEFFSVALKGGNKEFAPTWDLLSRSKSGVSDSEQYTREFIPLMRISYKENQDSWKSLINKDKVAIACYCRNGNFCHRYLLVSILKSICDKHGIEFEYCGEII